MIFGNWEVKISRIDDIAIFPDFGPLRGVSIRKGPVDCKRMFYVSCKADRVTGPCASISKYRIAAMMSMPNLQFCIIDVAVLTKKLDMVCIVFVFFQMNREQ